jgi:preprotein translocase subunit Sec63
LSLPRHTRRMSATSMHINLAKYLRRLTDETIRKNLEEYGHPDGRQETSMGIAIPPWMVEGKNTIWVLLAYALLLGGSLPYIVVRITFITLQSPHHTAAGTLVVWLSRLHERRRSRQVRRDFLQGDQGGEQNGGCHQSPCSYLAAREI